MEIEWSKPYCGVSHCTPAKRPRHRHASLTEREAPTHFFLLNLYIEKKPSPREGFSKCVFREISLGSKDEAAKLAEAWVTQSPLTAKQLKLLSHYTPEEPVELIKSEGAKLKEAKKIILELLKVAPIVSCTDFHHGKKDQHQYGEPCPVKTRHDKMIERAREFVNKKEK